MKGLMRSSVTGLFLVVVPAYLLSAQGLLGPEKANKDELREMTSTVLSGLGAATLPVPDPAPKLDPEFIDPDMRAVTDNVLAGLGFLGTVEEPELVDELARQVTLALAEGESNAYIETLLTAASDAGVVSVPAALTTAEGRVDVATLRTSFDAEAAMQRAPARPAAPVALATEVPADLPILIQGGEWYYIVQRGDSLGGIAYRVYGRTSQFVRIYDANRDKLSSPDRITVGQRLLIPQG